MKLHKKGIKKVDYSLLIVYYSVGFTEPALKFCIRISKSVCKGFDKSKLFFTRLLRLGFKIKRILF